MHSNASMPLSQKEARNGAPSRPPLTRRASDRLDWMYAGSLAAKEDATKKQEEALLGQRPAQLPDTAEPGAKVRVGCCCSCLLGGISCAGVSCARRQR